MDNAAEKTAEKNSEVTQNPVQVSDLRRQVRSLNGNTRIGFSDSQGFELMYRVATMISRSELVPDIFRETIEVKKGANKGTLVKNPSGIPNSMLALNVATQLDMDVLMVMGNMMVIEGRLSWSSQFVIAAVNRSKKFTAIRFDVVRDKDATEYEYVGKEWDAQQNRYSNVKRKVKLINRTCIAWAIEKETGERVESPEVSLEMAVAEGWYGKNGSKWKTMPDVMLRYRAASFFGKLYAPDMLMGMPSEDELEDMLPEVQGQQGQQTQQGQENQNAQGPGTGRGGDNGHDEGKSLKGQGGEEPEKNPEPTQKGQPDTEEKGQDGKAGKPPAGNGRSSNGGGATRASQGSNQMDLRKNQRASRKEPEHGPEMEPGPNFDEDGFETMTDEELLAQSEF